MIVTASCSRVPGYFNRTLRATVPACWRVTLDDALPESPTSVYRDQSRYFDGFTRDDAIRSAVGFLQSQGFTGRLRLHP